MTTYAFPSITPTEMTIGVITNTRAFTSPFTGAVQTVQRGGARVSLRMVFRNLSSTDRQDMIAFIAKLNGMEHRFSVRDYGHTQRGAFTGASNPLVKGAGQTGNTLTIDGCDLSTTNWLRAADRFRVGNEYKILTADANTNGAGETTLTFWPPLRNSPADNAPVVVGAPVNASTEPVGVFMLTQSNVDWSTGAGPAFSDFVIEAVEDVLA